jgi:hypothetical protein
MSGGLASPGRDARDLSHFLPWSLESTAPPFLQGNRVEVVVCDGLEILHAED